MKFYYFKHILLLLISLFISGNSFSAPTVKENSKQMVVVIDPGHGGKDPGAVSKGIQEKDVVLGIGLKLGKYISENFSDVKVVFTRNTDVFVPLIDRSRIANRNKADLFISLHANTCGTPSLRGTETFVLGLHRSNDNLDVAKKENSVILMEDNYRQTYEGFDPNSSESYIMFEMVQDNYLDQSLSFADDIQRQFKSRLESSNRGVKQAGFLVLRESSMPSVLVETGFVSNQAEANYLKSDEGQHVIASSILDAFRRFKIKSSGTMASTRHTANSSTKPDTSALTALSEKKKEISPEETTTENKSESAKKIVTEKTKSAAEPIVKIDSLSDNELASSNVYYSVQIGANTIPIEPSANNFKGLKEVRREKTDKYYRYYIGKESSMENITPILQKIKLKFSQAFIVYFIDGKRTIINTNSN
ncbi:N-acetylmuramoyl-L-alanine amidase [Aquipluma nitroreducens]|uniref:N-acetylmuramoyl-L-alanine amidase n=1 Tax=Aquipluma nitroreducens TaxID=2010828 RepID=A0A5K7SGZ4_9BACT|nr:N-acetylmuramoyl-L-alanine amidase [Aquipluma nitroreducens]BBE20892.1 N-acetylmuramoyl-L-alanine amidase [Aquipluma nitroreducens]